MLFLFLFLFLFLCEEDSVLVRDAGKRRVASQQTRATRACVYVNVCVCLYVYVSCFRKNKMGVRSVLCDRRNEEVK